MTFNPPLLGFSLIKAFSSYNIYRVVIDDATVALWAYTGGSRYQLQMATGRAARDSTGALIYGNRRRLSERTLKYIRAGVIPAKWRAVLIGDRSDVFADVYVHRQTVGNGYAYSAWIGGEQLYSGPSEAEAFRVARERKFQEPT